MKISISEARRRLAELVQQVRKDPGGTVQITVRDEVVAELRAAQPESEAAAKKLLELMTKLPKHRGRRAIISSHAKEPLCGHAWCCELPLFPIDLFQGQEDLLPRLGVEFMAVEAKKERLP